MDPDFLLWACAIPDEDPIPLIQSPKGNAPTKYDEINDHSNSSIIHVIYLSVFFFVSCYDHKIYLRHENYFFQMPKTNKNTRVYNIGV